MTDAQPGEPGARTGDDLLDGALQAFMASGFHAASPADLEGATGEAWQAIRALFGDKEGLFYAAADYGAAASPDAPSHDDVRRMLERLLVVDNNPRLRSIHREAIRKVSRLSPDGDP